MWKWIAIVSLFAVAAQSSWTTRDFVIAKDQIPNASHPQRIADAVMQRIKARDLHTALIILSDAEAKKLPADAFAAQIDKGVQQLMKEFGRLEDLGQPLGEIDYLGRDVIGQSYVAFTYLERFERRALVWRITFYRVRDEWIASNIDWNQDISPHFRADLSAAIEL